jgi:tetratricopeptide (TPR) repeat protein
MMHLGKDEVGEFFAGQLDAARLRGVLLHLLSGCSLCRQCLLTYADSILGEEPWMTAPPVEEGAYDETLARTEVFARRLDKRWQKESEKLDRALALLDQAPGGLGDVSFPWRQAQALHGWPLCEALLRKSYEARFSNPKRMLNLAQSATGVAKNLKLEKYPWPGFIADLRARAAGELGNAYRVNLQFQEAEKAFERAREFLELGTGDPRLHAQILDLEASLRSSQRRLDDAITLLDQVHSLYLEAGDAYLAGRALISRGINTHYQGRPREAVDLFERGLQLLEPGRDPHLAAIAQEAYLHALTDCGEYRQASRLLLQSGLREAFAAEPLNLLKLRWVEGKIHAGSGRLAQAERAFSGVRSEFLRRAQIYDAALVGLELAAVWLRQGRSAEVGELAEELHATFDDLGVQTEAARALYFVREACRRRAVTVPMIERARQFLERLPWHPGLRFEPALIAP